MLVVKEATDDCSKIGQKNSANGKNHSKFRFLLIQLNEN